MRRSALVIGILILTVGACTPAPLPMTVSTSTDTPTATAEPQLAETQTVPPTPTLTCEAHTASMVLSVSDETPQVGGTVKVTVTLNNEGCVALGLPQYRLRIRSDTPESVFASSNLEPVVHYLAVAPGQSDTAEFDLRAIADGQVTLSASASFEVHLGYPGPAYWGSSSSGEHLISVAP